MPQLMACIVEILIYCGNGPNCQRSPHVEPFKALTQRTFACPLAGRMAFGVGRNSGASTLGSWSQWWLWRWLCKRGKYENNNMFIYIYMCVIHAFICLVYLFVVFVLYITSNIYICKNQGFRWIFTEKIMKCTTKDFCPGRKAVHFCGTMQALSSLWKGWTPRMTS